MFSPVILASVLSAVRAYSICSPSDVKGPISIPINNVLVASSIQVSGNIEIVDGCSFKVTGFRLQNSSPAKWYGGIGTSTAGVTVSDGVVSSSADQTFTFRNVVGSEVSFRDFDQFRLLEESTQTLIATAQVPASIRANLGSAILPIATGNTTTGGTNVTTTGRPNTTTTGGTSQTTGGTKSTSTPAQPPVSSAQTIGSGMLGLLLAFF